MDGLDYLGVGFDMLDRTLAKPPPDQPLGDLASGHDRRRDNIFAGLRGADALRTLCRDSLGAAEVRRDHRDAQNGGAA